MVYIGISNQIDGIVVETEEIEEGDDEAVINYRNVKEILVAIWKLLQKMYRYFLVFWSRVPTRNELEHRHMASLCRVVEDGREMMDAAQFASSNADYTNYTEVADKKTQ